MNGKDIEEAVIINISFLIFIQIDSDYMISAGSLADIIVLKILENHKFPFTGSSPHSHAGIGLRKRICMIID